MKLPKETNRHDEFVKSFEKKSFNHEFIQVEEIKSNKSVEFPSLISSKEFNQNDFSSKKRNNKNKIRDKLVVKSGLSFGTVSTAGVVITTIGVVALTATAVTATLIGVSFEQINTGLSYIKCELNIKNTSYDNLLFYAENVDDTTESYKTTAFLNDESIPYILFEELEPATSYAITAKSIDDGKIFKLGTYSTLEIPKYNIDIDFEKSSLYAMTFNVNGAENSYIEANIHNANGNLIASKYFAGGTLYFDNLVPTEMYTLTLFQEGFEVGNKTFATSIIVPEYKIEIAEKGSTHIGVFIYYDYNCEASFLLCLFDGDNNFIDYVHQDGFGYYYNDLIPGRSYILKLINYGTSVIEEIRFESDPIPDNLEFVVSNNTGRKVEFDVLNWPSDSDLVLSAYLYDKKTNEQVEKTFVFYEKIEFGEFEPLMPVNDYYVEVLFESQNLSEPIHVATCEFRTRLYEEYQFVTYRSFEYTVDSLETYEVENLYAEAIINGVTQTFNFELDNYGYLNLKVDGLQDETKYTIKIMYNDVVEGPILLYDIDFITAEIPSASASIDEIYWDGVLFSYNCTPEDQISYVFIYEEGNEIDEYYSGGFNNSGQDVIHYLMPSTNYIFVFKSGIDLEFEADRIPFTTSKAPEIKQIQPGGNEFSFDNPRENTLTASLYEESDVAGEYTTLVETIEFNTSTFAFTNVPTKENVLVVISYSPEEVITSQTFVMELSGTR